MRNKIIVLLCLTTLCLGLCACGSKAETKEDKTNEVLFVLENTVPEQIKTLSVRWSSGEKVFCSSGVEQAGGGYLTTENYPFALTRSEVQSEEQLKSLTVTVSLTDNKGVSGAVAAIQGSASFGDELHFSLRYEDGCYSLWQRMSNGVYAHVPGAQEEASDPKPAEEPERSSVDYEEIYAPVLSKYRTALTEAWDVEKCMSEDVCYMLGMYFHTTAPMDFGYTVTDLDGDGVSELLIGAGASVQEEFLQKLILALYTVKDGECVSVFNSTERNRYYYLGGECFANVGSSAWNDSTDTTLTFAAGTLTPSGGAAETEKYAQISFAPFDTRERTQAATMSESFDIEDLVGPWHLDPEKNDIAAIAGDIDSFPSFAEFGSAMELRSNGQMSWSVGAAGGSGTYSMEGRELYAELDSFADGQRLSMLFAVNGTKDAPTLTVEYKGRILEWTHGEGADMPEPGTYVDRQGTADVYSSLSITPDGDCYTVHISIYRLTQFDGSAIVENGRLYYRDNERGIEGVIRTSGSGAAFEVTVSDWNYVPVGEIWTFPEQA